VAGYSIIAPQRRRSPHRAQRTWPPNTKIVYEKLGHSTIAKTLDTYSHVLPNMRDAAAAAMEEALS
jgi:integrase